MKSYNINSNGYIVIEADFNGNRVCKIPKRIIQYALNKPTKLVLIHVVNCENFNNKDFIVPASISNRNIPGKYALAYFIAFATMNSLTIDKLTLQEDGTITSDRIGISIPAPAPGTVASTGLDSGMQVMPDAPEVVEIEKEKTIPAEPATVKPKRIKGVKESKPIPEEPKTEKEE